MDAKRSKALAASFAKLREEHSEIDFSLSANKFQSGDRVFIEVPVSVLRIIQGTKS